MESTEWNLRFLKSEEIPETKRANTLSHMHECYLYLCSSFHTSFLDLRPSSHLVLGSSAYLDYKGSSKKEFQFGVVFFFPGMGGIILYFFFNQRICYIVTSTGKSKGITRADKK